MANIPFLNNAYFSAKVGIGTDGPAYKLDVNSSAFVGARIESTAAGYAPASILLESGDSDSRGQGIYQYNSVSKNSWFSGVPYSTTSDDWIIAHKLEATAFNSDVAQMSNALFCVNDDGFVGIGTTNSVYKLQVYDASSSQVRITNGLATPVDLQLFASSSSYAGIGTASNHRLALRTNNTEKATILANGNVGIGTISPSTELSVNGAISAITSDYVHGTTGSRLLMHSAGTGNSHSYIQAQNSGGASNAEDLALQLYGGNVGIGTDSPTSLLEVSQNLSAASTIDYPYTISSRDDANSINQAGGEGVGIKFRIAGNAATTPGDSLVGASIAAIRESSSDADSSTGLGFFVTQNDETLDEALRIDHDRNANFLSNVNITNSLDVTDTIDIGTQTWKGYTNTPAKLNVEVSGGRAINIYNTAEDAAYLSFIDSQSNDGQYANLSFNSSSTNAFVINNMGYETTISNVGAWTFTEAVSGITPTVDANFVTKAYADGLTPGAGVFLPLIGGTMTGNIVMSNNTELRWKDNGEVERTVLELDSSNNLYLGKSGGGTVNIVSGTSYTTALSFDSSQDASFRGNIAVGNVALATDTLTPMGSITLPGNAKLFGYANSIYSISNAYYDGGWKYLTTNTAAVLNIGSNGQAALTLRQVASGTADDAITFTTSFEIDSSGDATFSGTVDAPTFEGNLTGNVTGNVTGNLTGVVNSTSSLADGVIGATQADSDDSTLIATTAFVQNLIETIPAGLVFQGTWDARTAAEGGATGDEGSPALVSGVGTTGHFYIVSNSGSVDLDGITDWVTGDWAVFVEVGATDSWQKIDNSSVLDGSGTGQTVPLWSGSGTSNTLTDSVVTQDSTNIGIGIAIPLHKLDIESDDNSLIKIRNTTNGGGASIEFNDNNASTDSQNGQITYYHSDGASQGGGASFWFEAQPDTTLVVGNGTNTGRVVVGGNSATEVGYGFYDDINTGMFKPTNHQLGFATNGTNRLTIASSAADFAVPIKTIIGTAAIPALQIGDTDSGFYDSGANLISVSLGGVKSATFHPGGRFQAVSSIQAGDDTNTAGASRVGAMRYRTGTEYVEVTGTELVTNGDFLSSPASSGWTAPSGWTITTGNATWNAAATYTWISSSVGTVVGNVYKVSFDCVVTSGDLRVILANGGGTPSITATGSYEYILTPTGGGVSDTLIRVYQTVANSNFSITNISAIQVTAEDASYADMCMQTGASTYEWVNIVRNTY